MHNKFWPDWNPTKRLAHYYAIKCMAHRVRKFGFEESVNLLDPRSLALFGLCVHEPFATKCLERAIACDPEILRIMESTVCPT